jgi:hypothetical protein
MLETVLADIGDHLESADRLCAEYARDYVASLQGGPRVRPPATLHPQLAKLVRELALDAASTTHRFPMRSQDAA